MAGFRWIKRTEDNTTCACPCACGRQTEGGAVMCSTCAAELCKHE